MDDKHLATEACDIIRGSFDKFEKEIREICGLTDSVDEWLDSRQICERLKISIRTLNYYRVRMIVPYTRFGNKCYYKVSDVVQVLEENGNKK